MAQKKSSQNSNNPRGRASAKTKKPAVKKAAVKKTAAKKPALRASTAKKSAVTSDLKKSLISRLTLLCRGLESENIQFLIAQAEVFTRNKKVKEAVEKRRSEKPSTPGRGMVVPRDKFHVAVKESDDGASFMIGINNYQNFFSRDEMKRLVRICQAASDARDAGLRMYTWFKNERGDILYNTGIEGPSDPALATMYKYLIKTYTVKK